MKRPRVRARIDLSQLIAATLLILVGVVVIIGMQIRQLKSDVNGLMVWETATSERLDVHLGPYDFP